MRCVPNPRERIELAFAIGRRSGPAVVRNRIRRRIRAAFHELAADGMVPPGMYLVGVHGSGVENCRYQDLKMELVAHLSRVAGPPAGSQPGAGNDPSNPTPSAQMTRDERDRS